MTLKTQTGWTITVHDPRRLGLDERLEAARLSAACFAFSNPEDPPPSPETEAAAMVQDWGDEGSLLVLARAGQETLVGLGRIEYDLKQNTDKAYLNVQVLPGWRRLGLGRRLAGRLAQEALALGRTVYTAATSTRTPAARPFAGALGARAALPMRVSELQLPKLDHFLLHAWVTRPDGDPYRLRRYELVPPEDLARVAKVYDVMNTAPRGEMDFDDWLTTPESVEKRQQGFAAIGGRTLLYVVEHVPSGDFVAFSQVGWTPDRAALVQQWGTGVRPDHQGRGLGKWAKAAVLLDLPAHNPQATRIRTGNADENAAMLGINVALGFEPTFNRTEWQGQVQELLEKARAE